MENLKNCPTCKRNDVRVFSWHDNGFLVMCTDCGLEGPASDTRDNAIDAWNSYPREETEQDETAPDLLSVCEELVDAMHRYQMDVEGQAPYRHIEMMRRAYAAIAKAKPR